MLTHSQSAVYPVLMETIAPISTAEIGAIDTVYLPAPLMGFRPLGCIDRMVIDKLSNNLGSINHLSPIEGYAEINRGGEALEHIHVIGQSCPPQLLTGDMVVPACPGNFPPREE